MLTIRTEQSKALGDAAPNTPIVRPCGNDLHWIEFQLLDAQGEPIPGEPFQVRLPDQSMRTGTTDQDGKVRFDSIVAGEATISDRRGQARPAYPWPGRT